MQCSGIVQNITKWRLGAHRSLSDLSASFVVLLWALIARQAVWIRIKNQFLRCVRNPVYFYEIKTGFLKRTYLHDYWVNIAQISRGWSPNDILSRFENGYLISFTTNVTTLLETSHSDQEFRKSVQNLSYEESSYQRHPEDSLRCVSLEGPDLPRCVWHQNLDFIRFCFP